MIFGEWPVAEALGVVLAHSKALPGRTLPKGCRIDEDAQAALLAAGVTVITAARLDADDVEEDVAARRIADALAGPGLARTRAHTGRCNLESTGTGLVRVDAARLTALNMVHEGLTVATVADGTRVSPSSPVATIKIIPYALPGSALDRAAELIGDQSPLTMAAFRPLRVGLVVSEVTGGRDQIARKAAEVTRRRIRALTGTMLPVARVPHTEAAIAAALSSLRAQAAELLLVAGGAAITDRADIAAAAIIRAGGTIDHFGMPVDPGNLMCMGQLGDLPAIVLPSCARSVRPNGIDLILSRIFAGQPVGTREIAAFGVGGLLTGATALAPVPMRKKVAALVLAAGFSRRMHPWDKLFLRDGDGRSVISRTVDAVLASDATATVVVAGRDAAPLRAELAGRHVSIVEAQHHADGLSASLRAGLAALPAGTEAVLVCLGDMPLVSPDILNQIIAAHDPGSGGLIVVPHYQGRRGNPVLWDARLVPDLLSLSGDTGGRALLSAHRDKVVALPVADAAILTDLDTQEDAAALSLAP